MSGLIGGLITASQALTAQQTGVQVAGRNLANVNTPGYARQRVHLGDRAVLNTLVGPIGSGVEALGIQQMRDQLLDTAVTREVGQSASLDAQLSALQRAEASLGEQISRSAGITGNGQSSTGLSATINDFFNGFDNLAANPSDPGVRQVLFQKAGLLVNKFNVIDQRLSGLQSDLSSQIGNDVKSVNSLLRQIADINGEIAQSELAAPGAAVDLRDQRQSRMEDLAKYLDFAAKPIVGGNGQIEISVKDAGGADVVLVSKTTVRGGVAFDGVSFSAGLPATPVAIEGGALHGNLLARDGAVQGLRDDLAKTARQIASSVNSAYNPGGTGTDFFQNPPASGLMALDPTLRATTLRATATTNSGANEIALAVADVARRRYSVAGGDSIDGTIDGFFAQTVSGFGEAIAGVDTELGDQKLVEQMVTTQRESVSGVSLDEEMADLMKFQRAYQASARVIRVMDELLDGLVNGLVR